MGQPALPRYQWELDTAITSIRELTDMPIVLLFTDYDQSVIDHFTGRYPNLEIHSYPDQRDDRNYPATTRPYLIWRYLEEDSSRERETYLQLDSDIILRAMPILPQLGKNEIIGADCGGYIDYQYLRTRRNGEVIVDNFAKILNIDRSLIENTPGIGAQFCYSNPTARLWWHIWQDSDLLYQYLETVDSDIQRWTAEMWSQLYNFAKYGWRIGICHELDHCTPTDNIEMWEHRNILHNAGVVGEGAAGLVYKGKYVTESPFTEDLSWVRRDKAGWHYARAIENAARYRVQ